ncbi:DUF5927 domain-containing protein [Actibacterium pelagium]|uniref:Peptide O-xylosyltransferase n=1 Tax=Actibacterium pelagium TaxID=2029103 RepID=A0A917AIT8_9RHOB|nr:beta-1,6-N-acetylglucosaminyltransferase [Actibacterium pelagium]GGE56394.1 glycosyl transferase [Actibacterium pelagium]
MTVGVIMLAHTALDRASTVARYFAQNGCPVMIHCDKSTPLEDYENFVRSLSGVKLVSFVDRVRVDWGTWTLVSATLKASEALLEKHPEVQHVMLASGSCLPLRPVSELRDYLAQHPKTDFIESVTTRDVRWTIGGLDEERFHLRFPFSWKRHRRFFDRYVALQRRIGFRRKIPRGLIPHLGSQWWCLTRSTLTSILEGPRRAEFDTYFKRVWIPDESYFQTLVRYYGRDVESRSLTLSKFDFHGKPHVFYDDHLQLLRNSDCFMVRKVWPNANRLYREFLRPAASRKPAADPNPGKIERVFAQSRLLRHQGRRGLYMTSRFPCQAVSNRLTAAPYSVFQGFTDIFEDFEGWLARVAGGHAHGHLFAPEGAEFSAGATTVKGGLTSDAGLRDHNPKSFLTNLLWNLRGERQSFQFSPRDNQAILRFIADDPNAQLSVITGTWALPLFHAGLDAEEARKKAAYLQRVEASQLEILQSPHCHARVRIWSLTDFLNAPADHLQLLTGDLGLRSQRQLTEIPRLKNLEGFDDFLINLRNAGMQIQLLGTFPQEMALRQFHSKDPQQVAAK